MCTGGDGVPRGSMSRSNMADEAEWLDGVSGSVDEGGWQLTQMWAMRVSRTASVNRVLRKLPGGAGNGGLRLCAP